MDTKEARHDRPDNHYAYTGNNRVGCIRSDRINRHGICGVLYLLCNLSYRYLNLFRRQVATHDTSWAGAQLGVTMPDGGEPLDEEKKEEKKEEKEA